MEGGNVFGGSNDMISLLENPNKLWLPSSSSFHGMMMNFDQEPQQIALTTLKRNRNDGSIMQTGDGEDTGEEETDLNRSEKKRRLTSQQVKFLEKSFEEEKKLEPERKVELATQLGLEPRQVAIWFQNRRARYKTKQIEKEYDVLKDSYERLKVDYDSLNKLNEKLQNEVQVLKERLGENDKNETNSNLDTILQFEQVPSGIAQLHGMVDNTNSIVNVLIPCTKQVEDASSAKSDVIDSESPPCTDANQSSVHAVEASSTFMREFDQTLSEFSQEDEEHLLMNNNLLLPQTPPTINNFLKLTGDIEYDPNASSSNNSNALLVDDDQSSFWSWFYS